MTLPLLLCVLVALTSGLYFGRRFAQAHHQGANIALPALAHGVIATPLMVLSAVLDPTEAGTGWMVVAFAALGGLALGALLPRRAAAQSGVAPAAQPFAAAQNAQARSAA